MTTTRCPGREQLEHLAARRSAPAPSKPVAAHITSCPRCAAELEQIRVDNELLAECAGALSASRAVSLSSGRAVDVTVPGYEIVREIHRGAQGIVYEAMQQSTKRRVALKMLLHGAFAGARQRNRFEREVEIVAGLRHPNIVTLYESGELPDGQLYLAMELVEGAPLHQHVESPPRSGPALRRLVELFAAICAAVNAAHQRGIIHRDLKPANILVDRDGQPHVLDFGLARRTEPDQAVGESAPTIAGEFLGTFAYAAPEQVRGDPEQIDVRTDVYALGVILYELLAGVRPYEIRGSVADAVHVILNCEPARPSTVNRAVNDELDTIALKALMKDAQRRYQSAGALLEDLRHYLAGEAINAKRDSQWYLLRKMIARHRVPLGLAAVLFIAAIATATAMAVLKQRADGATVTSTRTLMSFLRLLESDPLWRRSGEDTLPQALAKADTIAGTELAGQPEIEAAVRTRLGEVHLRRGSYAAALTQFELARHLREQVEDGDTPEIAESLHNCARAQWYLGDYAQAEKLYREALQMRIAVRGREHEDVAQTMSHLAATFRQQGRYHEAETLYQSVLAMRRDLHGRSHPAIAASLNNLGVCLRDQRRYEEAVSLFRESLAMIRALKAEEDEHVAATLHSLAICLIAVGKLEEAGLAVEEALAIKHRLLEDTHPAIALTRALKALVLLRAGDLAAAAEEGTAALAAQEAAYGADHKDIADTLQVLGQVELARRAAMQAESRLRQCLRLRLTSLPANHWTVAEARGLLGESLLALNRADEAEPLLLQSYRDLLLTQTQEDGQTQAAVERLAKLYESLGRGDEAARYRAQLSDATLMPQR